MKKMGRPRKENNMGKVCTIRLDDQTLERLEIYCERLNIAKSEAIRTAINELVDECNIKDETE
ncbi:ribbon-helix-helix protein, CopG family [Suilimivivens aceti]|uniref:Ribbon-helix-helix protein, CopG family n=1 Tax=Suilimivivens aceti TaxID=2981774 RepID=A0ABT2T4F3_9FIRM|nr:ribbon-helix-helix protein, CopG family [Suilimivivens aceti]MCU6745140.1 ribbon-helix-helix protein, CopG family [Suilimivivens aceti]SCI08076.1 Ribbon-helix-helix protein%2C copG family [uncultured Clostridium sp.]